MYGGHLSQPLVRGTPLSTQRTDRKILVCVVKGIFTFLSQICLSFCVCVCVCVFRGTLKNWVTLSFKNLAEDIAYLYWTFANCLDSQFSLPLVEIEGGINNLQDIWGFFSICRWVWTKTKNACIFIFSECCRTVLFLLSHWVGDNLVHFSNLDYERHREEVQHEEIEKQMIKADMDASSGLSMETVWATRDYWTMFRQWYSSFTGFSREGEAALVVM